VSNDNGQNGNGGNQQLVKPGDGKGDDPVRALQLFLRPRMGKLAEYARNSIKPETLLQMACFEFSRNDELRKCRIETIYSALILAAQLGLEPSAVRGEAYLVPFKGTCTLVPGYRGLIKLARRSREVTDLYAHPVYEADEYHVELGSTPRVHHVPSTARDRGEIVAAYAVAHLTNAKHPDVEPMGWDDLDQIVSFVKSSRGGRMPATYDQWEGEMLRKAPLRRLCKRLPMGDDYFKAAHVDAMVQAGKPEAALDIIDADFEDKPAGASSFDSVAAKVREKADRARQESKDS